MTLDDWLYRLESQHPVAIDLGLERVKAVAERLGLLSRPLARRVIVVAGTNGKGSTVAMLERLGRAHGLTTASYTSPHLIRYNERLCFEGVPASDELLVVAFEQVEAARLAGEVISLTYFEAGTLAALHAIGERAPDLAILEVGLGGRLDAVNVIDSDVAVITTIAHDHADFLGNDLEGIGREKAGILRLGRPAVLGSRSLPASVSARIAELEVSDHWLGQAFERDEIPAGGWRWRGEDASGRPLVLDELPDPGLPLDNAAAALQSLSLCGLELHPEAAREAFATVSLAGRMQWLGQWCFDVAHNPHAATYVASRLAGRSRPARRIGLLGVLDNKDAEALVQSLAPAIDRWLPVGLAGPRGRSSENLAACVERAGGEILLQAASPAAGVAALIPLLTAEDEVLVCGSFFTVAEALGVVETIRSGDCDAPERQA